MIIPLINLLYDHGHACTRTTFNFQKQNRWAYEARLTSQGDSKLQWMAGAFYEDVYDWWQYGAQQNQAQLGEETRFAGKRRNRRACEDIADPRTSPLARSRSSLLLEQVPQRGEAGPPSSAK